MIDTGSLMVGDSAKPSSNLVRDGLRVALTVRNGSFLRLLATNLCGWICFIELDIVFGFEQTDDADE